MMQVSHFVAAAILGILALAGGLMPLLLHECGMISPARRRRILALGSMFSGGLLVAAGFIHLVRGSSRVRATLGSPCGQFLAR